MKATVAIFEQLVPISGGGTPRTTHIIRALRSRGHAVSVAAAFAVPREEAQRELDAAVVPLPNVSRLDKRKMLRYLYVYPWNILRLALHIARHRPDVVIAHNTIAGFGALLGRLLSPRTVTVVDLTDLMFEYLDSYPQAWMRAVAALGRAMERYTIRHSDRVITISSAMRDILVQGYGVRPENVDIVHDGVDCTRFQPGDGAALRARITPAARSVCVIHGVIDPQDEPEILVDAAPLVLERLPDTAFWWVGDGSAIPGIRDRARKLGIGDRFFYSGWVKQPEVVEYIRAADLGIVVLPDVVSARGRVTLKEFEYWACARPAILPRLPALQEIVPEGEASLFYTPGDRADLADKICALLSDDARRATMGEKGRAMVTTRFEWHVLADTLVRLCESYLLADRTQASTQQLGGTR